jgi:endonuclease YncB( thermonuclease family)
MRAVATLGLSAAALVVGAGFAAWTAQAPPPAAPAVVAAMPSAAGSSVPVAAPAAPARGGDLPTRDVPTRPVHSIREDAALATPPVTLLNRNGQVITRIAGAPPRTEPAPAPTAAAAGPAVGTVLAGAAQPAGGTRIAVSGRPLRLFGVKAPESRDRCVQGGAATHPCDDVARQTLANRLAANPAVTCRLPPGQDGGDPGAICLDSTGADLAGLLVAEGLALADSRQSYDYVGAETVARSLKRGLWRNR